MVRPLRLGVLLALGGFVTAQEPASRPDSVIVAVVGPGLAHSAPALGTCLLPSEAVVTDGPASDVERALETSSAEVLQSALSDARKSWEREADLLRVLPVRATAAGGSVTTEILAEAIRKSVQRGARVLVVLISGARSSEKLEAALKEAEAKGCLVFASSGQGPEMFDLQPAAFPWVISCTRVTAGDAVEARLAVNACASGKTELAGATEEASSSSVALRAAVMAALLIARRSELTAVNVRDLLRFHGPRAVLDEHDWPFRRLTPGAFNGVPSSPAPFVDAVIEDAWLESGAARSDESSKAIVKIRNLGSVSAEVKVECVVEGSAPVESRPVEVGSGATATVELTLPALPEGVHVVRARLVAKNDVNVANDSWLFRVASSRSMADPLLRRVRVVGFNRETGKALVAGEVFHPGPGKRAFDLSVRLAEASFSKALTLEPGVFNTVSLEIEIPDPNERWQEVPLLLFLNQDGRRVAFDGALLRVDFDPFKP